jgi:tRNA(fMet)-specific endonuclease VapC
VIRFLIDTDCAIHAMLGTHPPLRARMAKCEPGEIALSAINFAEIVRGNNLGYPPDRVVIDDFVTVVPIVPFDDAAAHEYARLAFKRASFERLVAAHALSIGAIVITNNEADFADVPGLKLENWTLPL